MVSALPPTFSSVVAGDELKIGGRVQYVMTGDAMRPNRRCCVVLEDKILLAADQGARRSRPTSASGRSIRRRSARLYIRLALRGFKNLPKTRWCCWTSIAILRPAREVERTDRTSRKPLRDDRRGEREPRRPNFVPVIFHRPLDPYH